MRIAMMAITTRSSIRGEAGLLSECRWCFHLCLLCSSKILEAHTIADARTIRRGPLSVPVVGGYLVRSYVLHLVPSF